ncbi:MAG: flippase-like domain-containing protein [Flavobacteriales bacterium]|nr:flippase-like domain-containing protein [Flavobacteriales bacterium]
MPVNCFLTREILLRAVFSGTSVSVFTPNRIGDFGARVLYLDNSDRIAAVFITIVGSISQLVITILLGFLGMSLYTISHYPEMIEPVLAYLLFGVLALATFLTLVSYFNVSIITNWGKRLFKLFGLSRNQPIFSRLKRYVEVFSLYTSRELSISLGYSLLRYCVFSLQFYLLLVLFDVDIQILHALGLISITFFVMAVIPTIALTEIGVRGSVALFFLGLASENSIGIVTATFTLWIINLALPALIGSILVFGTNIFNAKR